MFPTKYGGSGKIQYCGRHRIDLKASPILLSNDPGDFVHVGHWRHAREFGFDREEECLKTTTAGLESWLSG